MYSLLYLHGFLSSPQSFKAQFTLKWMSEHRPKINLSIPALSSYPSVAAEQILAASKQLEPPIYVIGSSLGGFWATYLVENNFADKAVLINPAVKPQTRIDEFIDIPLKSYSGDEKYTTLTQKDLQDLIALDTLDILEPSRYWLMVQTGDETLNYRDAVKKYHKCKQVIEQGGNHAFNTYTTWLPNIIDFFEHTLVNNT